jgi:hypothetical protein
MKMRLFCGNLTNYVLRVVMPLLKRKNVDRVNVLFILGLYAKLCHVKEDVWKKDGQMDQSRSIKISENIEYINI